jgi:hypothetical protein
MKITTMNDSELLSQGFTLLVKAFGDVNAERFIVLTNRGAHDYTRWRENNMYIGESVRETAARAKAVASRLDKTMALA